MKMASRWKVLSLYRKLLRESQQFTDFNYRQAAWFISDNEKLSLEFYNL